jgi:hypothetical protein
MHDDSLAELPPAGARAAPPGPPSRTDLRPLLALLAWCLAFLAIRLLEHGTLERDEAEIVYLTQHLQLGYGPQPPLYAWFQWLFFEAFGVDRFSLLILKTLALASTCIAMFQVSRGLLGRRGAMAVTAALALFLQVGWEALRIQTHSVLMTAIACATLWLYFALLRRPTLARYAAFGRAVRAGPANQVQLRRLPGRRPRRQPAGARAPRASVEPQGLGGRAAGVLLVLPHAAWVATHADLAFAGTVRKMQDGACRCALCGARSHGATGRAEGLRLHVGMPALVLCGGLLASARAVAGTGRLPPVDAPPAASSPACTACACCRWRHADADGGGRHDQGALDDPAVLSRCRWASS